MSKEDLLEQLDELKLDYLRLQGDLEKLETTGQSTTPIEKQLKSLEDNMRSLREQLKSL
ncbi:MAG TPA: SE1832 family protein [Candidatus Angelobacter sp.]|nr:SE1832 family protein [Candidatus Angelobacter sp.]